MPGIGVSNVWQQSTGISSGWRLLSFLWEKRHPRSLSTKRLRLPANTEPKSHRNLSTAFSILSESSWNGALMSTVTDHIERRYAKLAAIREKGYDPYPHKFDLTHSVRQLVESYSDKSGEELEAENISVRTAGRLIAVRGHGKASFGHISGDGARIQIYLRQDRVGEESYELYR